MKFDDFPGKNYFQSTASRHINPTTNQLPQEHENAITITFLVEIVGHNNEKQIYCHIVSSHRKNGQIENCPQTHDNYVLTMFLYICKLYTNKLENIE